MNRNVRARIRMTERERERRALNFITQQTFSGERLQNLFTDMSLSNPMFWFRGKERLSLQQRQLPSLS